MPIIKKDEKEDNSVECRLMINFYENFFYNFEREKDFMRDSAAFKFKDEDFFEMLYGQKFKLKYHAFQKSNDFLLLTGKHLGYNTFFTGLHSLQDMFKKSTDNVSLRKRMKNMIDFYKNAQELGFEKVFIHEEADLIDFSLKAGENLETDGKIKDKAYAVDQDGRFDRIVFKVQDPTFIISKDLETTGFTSYIDLFGNCPNVNAMPKKEDLFASQVEDLKKLNKKEAINQFNNKFESLINKQKKITFRI